MKDLISILLFLFVLGAYSQEEINQFDETGKRHGYWKKTFEENPTQIRYEGSFDHGKEVGLFKFYQLGHKKPAATKEFQLESELVEVKYYSQQGKVISEGQMKGEDRIGKWTYYHKNSDKVMMVENYENGVLHGEKITYFKNGTPTERSFYRNGELHGEQLIYSEKKVLLKKFTYRNGLLHGPSKTYNGKGELLVEGEYRNNMHHGIWKYYQNNELKEEKDFSKNH